MQSNGSGNQHRISAAVTLVGTAVVACGLGLYYLAAPPRAPARVIVQPGAVAPLPVQPAAASGPRSAPIPFTPGTPVAARIPSATAAGSVGLSNPSAAPGAMPFALPGNAPASPAYPAGQPAAQQCLAVTHAGQRCRRMTMDPSGLCTQHRHTQPATSSPAEQAIAPSVMAEPLPFESPDVPPAPALSSEFSRGSADLPALPMRSPSSATAANPTPLPITPAGISPAPSSSPGSAQAPASVQCAGITASGARCRRMTTDPSGYCYQHRPR